MLRYARLRFSCQWLDNARRIHSPLHWRDDLESALCKVACVLPRQDCGQCIVRSRCTYVGLFRPALVCEGSNDKRTEPPMPFSLMFPESSDHEGRFQLELSLLQPWVDRLPYWIFALTRMGKSKLHPFVVLEGEQWAHGGWECFYDGRKEALEKEVQARAPCLPELTGGVLLRWLRPGRFFREGKPLTRPSFPDLVEALQRRIRNLQTWYGDGDILSPRELLEKAGEVSWRAMGLRWVERHRRSRRQGSTVALGGLMGEIFLEGNLEPFLELLALGRDLGVGKGTALGLGRYELAGIAQGG